MQRKHELLEDNCQKHSLPQNMIYWKIIVDKKVCILTSKDLMAKLNTYKE